MPCKTIDRSKLVNSEWQPSHVSPKMRGWYELKAEVGSGFETGKYCWLYWDGIEWYWPKLPAFPGKHRPNELPKCKHLPTFILCGDQWRGVVNG